MGKGIKDREEKKIAPKEYAKFWQSLMPEMKPLPSELRFWESKIEEILRRKKHPKALVLGVTPEIRDLLAKHRIDTVCLDKNPLMVKAMKLLLKRKNPNEKVVVGSWFRIPFSKETFDLVLSDCPHDNLPYKDLQRFFSSVSRVIKKEGYLMIGTHCFVGRVKPISFKQFIARYKKHPEEFRDPSKQFYHYLYLSGDPMIYNKREHTGDWEKLAGELERLHQKGVLSKKELREILFPVNKVKVSLAMKYTTLSQKEFLSLMKKSHLRLLGVLEDDEFPAGLFRQTYILKKS